MTFRLIPEPGSGVREIYLEVAAALMGFILTGLCFEARAKKRSAAGFSRCWRWEPRTSPARRP